MTNPPLMVKTTAGDIKPFDAAVMNLEQMLTCPVLHNDDGSVRDAEDIDRFTGELTLDDAHEQDPYTHAQSYTIHASGPGVPFAVRPFPFSKDTNNLTKKTPHSL